MAKTKYLDNRLLVGGGVSKLGLDNSFNLKTYILDVVNDTDGLGNTFALADGTAAAPSLFFDSDVDTGLFLSSTGTLGLAIAGTSLATLNANSFTVAGGVKSTDATAGIGYATGAGSTVTQITSITTGVTINAAAGEIKTVASTLAENAEATFTVTNSAVGLQDTIVLSMQSTSSAGLPVLYVSAVAVGSFDVTISNLAAAALDNTLTMNFAVIKGAKA
jgi:hypothetical protein